MVLAKHPCSFRPEHRLSLPASCFHPKLFPSASVDRERTHRNLFLPHAMSFRNLCLSESNESEVRAPFVVFTAWSFGKTTEKIPSNIRRAKVSGLFLDTLGRVNVRNGP